MKQKEVYKLAVKAQDALRAQRAAIREYIQQNLETANVALMRALLTENANAFYELADIIQGLEVKRICPYIYGQYCYGSKRCPQDGCKINREAEPKDNLLKILEEVEQWQTPKT